MQTSKNGIALIKYYESCKLKSYLCSAGVWTIGWGNTRYASGKKVGQNQTITQLEADKLFLFWLPNYENIVKKLAPSIAKQQVFDAMVSFAYNTGGHYLSKRTGKAVEYDIWDMVDSATSLSACANKLRTTAVTAKGKVIKGLVKRRESEAALLERNELILNA
jgi:lysozyme